jgi:hypothetical protein
MSRDFTPSELEDLREPKNPARERTPLDKTSSQERHGSPRRSADIERETQRADAHLRDSRTLLYDRDRVYRLLESEIHTLTDLGKFRVIATEDLAKHAYQGHREDAQQDLRNLTRQGLIERKTFQGPDGGSREMLTLTKTGHRFVRTNRLVSEGQATYHGFVKPREANHDADLYRLYQKEAEKIADKGGRNPRVVLDYELKKNLNRDFAKFGTEARQEIASRHGLQVVRNKIPVPDLRIEYETREGDMGRVDLELATEHYRPEQLAQKVRAGFSLYASRSEGDHLRRVLDQQELTAEILSL